MKIQSIGFIGGGRITRLLLQALKNKNSMPEKVLVADPDEEMRTHVHRIDSSCIQCVTDNAGVCDVDILFLAVHPPVFKQVAAEIGGSIKPDTIVVSFIPVLAIEKLFAMLGSPKLVRMIPNAPSLIHRGYNPVVYSDKLTRDEKEHLQDIFRNWGETPEVNENKLEGYAIVTAMGPTYFWFQWLKLQELGKKFGMNEAELKKAIPAMVYGAIDTLFESNFPVEDVLDLIPVCPLKEEETTIQEIFDKKLTALYARLSPK